jgi:hypothetical protein
VLRSSQQTGQQGFDTAIELLSISCAMHQIDKSHDNAWNMTIPGDILLGCYRLPRGWGIWQELPEQPRSALWLEIDRF